MANAKFYGTGRRKKSIARVYLVPGTGKITINKRDIDEYFGLETLKVVVRQPLVATETADKFDVLVNVHGGGYTGQAGAIRHGISRALLEADADYRPVLKAAGYLTRDPRMKERKKYGLKAARSAPQFSKRYFGAKRQREKTKFSRVCFKDIKRILSRKQLCFRDFFIFGQIIDRRFNYSSNRSLRSVSQNDLNFKKSKTSHPPTSMKDDRNSKKSKTSHPRRRRRMTVIPRNQKQVTLDVEEG